MEDREIIDLFFARNEEGILRLQEQYKAYCGKIASGVLSQKEDIEEVLNDSWLSIWNAIPPEKPLFLKAYCAKIVRNFAINRLKMLHAKNARGRNLRKAWKSLEKIFGFLLTT